MTMSINSINSAVTQVEVVHSNSGLNGVKKINNEDQKIVSNDFNKHLSQDQKNNSVSEKYDSAKSFVSYQTGLQSGTPLSNSKNASKSFNEKFKSSIVDYYYPARNNRFKNNVSETASDSNETIEQKGYYFVFDNSFQDNGIKKIKRSVSEIQKRIEKVYNFSREREPGTLVNLVV